MSNVKRYNEIIMLDFLFGNIVYLIIAILVIALLIFILSGYVKAPPDMAYIISGLKKEPKILIGRAGIKIPFLERKDTLLVKQVSIDIKTNGFIPYISEFQLTLLQKLEL